jgi:alpha-beta hydrolase superfamily lysophospholipase
MTSHPTRSTLTTLGGEQLAMYDWAQQPGVPLRGMVLIVHGLGEHAGRYGHVAQQLNAWGFAVRGYDQCGHGKSTGQRGTLSTDTQLLDDLAEMMDHTRTCMPHHTPLILLGHSMGGLVTGRFASLAMRKLEGLVMSSPALNPGMNALQRFLAGVLPQFVPHLRVGNGLDARFISHDPAVVQAYTADPLVHDRISTRLAGFFATQSAATLACAAQWQVPTLLMYAGSDHLVNPQGSRDFAATAPQALVHCVCFDALYHEIFNELDAAPVFAALRDWLDQRF